jgi:hypothetical protein
MGSSLSDIEGPKHAGAIRAFDYLVAAALGSSAALGSWWIVPEVLPGVVAMLLGMLVGTIAALPAFALFTWLLGGFEIVMMAMQIGMLAGMAAPMIQGGTPGSVALAGAGAGVMVHLLLHALDRSLHGEVRRTSAPRSGEAP